MLHAVLRVVIPLDGRMAMIPYACCYSAGQEDGNDTLFDYVTSCLGTYHDADLFFLLFGGLR
jgi:hypothetical protein